MGYVMYRNAQLSWKLMVIYLNMHDPNNLQYLPTELHLYLLQQL